MGSRKKNISSQVPFKILIIPCLMNSTNYLINNHAKIISDPSILSLFHERIFLTDDNLSNDNRLKIIIKMEIC